MWHLYYNIHNLVDIEITGNSRFARDNNLRYSFFQSPKMYEPDIVHYIGRFRPSNQGCQVVSHKYHIRENYLYCRDSIGQARWELEIFGIEEGKARLNFNGKRMDPVGILLQNYWAEEIVQSLVELRLANRNHYLIHGGAVSRDSKAYVFAGRTGVRKTTLIMDLVRRSDFNYLADERVIINQGKALCFPMSLFLFDFLSKHSLTENLGFMNRLRLVKDIFSRENHYSIPITNSAKLAALFIMERKDIGSVNTVEISLPQAVTKLVLNNKLEMNIPYAPAPSSHFLRYMMAYSFVFPRSRIAGYWEELRNGLESALKDTPIYLLEVPLNYDMRTFEEVRQYLEDI